MERNHSKTSSARLQISAVATVLLMIENRCYEVTGQSAGAPSLAVSKTATGTPIDWFGALNHGRMAR